jgi:hypothetical protein
MVFDSNLRDVKRMPCSYPLKGDRCTVPASLVKAFRLEAKRPDGRWETVYRTADNYQRLVHVPVNGEATALRLIPEATWGEAGAIRVLAFEATGTWRGRQPEIAPGPRFVELRTRVNPADLAPPESGLEAEPAPRRAGA